MIFRGKKRSLRKLLARFLLYAGFERIDLIPFFFSGVIAHKDRGKAFEFPGSRPREVAAAFGRRAAV